MTDNPDSDFLDNTGRTQRRRRARWGVIAAVGVLVAIAVTVPVLLATRDSTETVRPGNNAASPTLSESPPSPSSSPGALPAKCPERPPGPDAKARDTTPGELVPDGWSTVTVCAETVHTRGGTELDKADAARVLGTINALKPGRVEQCTFEYGGLFQVIVEYPDGRKVIVNGEPHGCQVVTAGQLQRVGGSSVQLLITEILGIR